MEKTDRAKPTEPTVAATNGTSSVSAPPPVVPAPVIEAAPPAPAAAPTAPTAPAYTLLNPTGAWPPPIFIDPSASDGERYYMEHRWYTQWSYYDGKASAAKQLYHRYQLIGVIGAGVVTALVGLSPIATDITVRNGLTVATVMISLLVTSATAIEAVKSYGDEWRNYRAAAEELKREKSLYDVRSGSYRKAKKPFLLFVERCEEIMAKQNGSWAALREEQQPQQGGAPVTQVARESLGVPDQDDLG